MTAKLREQRRGSLSTIQRMATTSWRGTSSSMPMQAAIALGTCVHRHRRLLHEADGDHDHGWCRFTFSATRGCGEGVQRMKNRRIRISS